MGEVAGGFTSKSFTFFWVSFWRIHVQVLPGEVPQVAGDRELLEVEVPPVKGLYVLEGVIPNLMEIIAATKTAAPIKITPIPRSFLLLVDL